jgi:hypothetical protein
MLIYGICGRDQVIHGEAENLLGLVIANNPHLGSLPSLSPGVDMGLEESLDPLLLDHGDMNPRCLPRIGNLA